MILMDGDLDIGAALDRLPEGMDKEDTLDSLWPWEQHMETSALNYPGLLLDCMRDSKQSLVRNDVVLSEGLGDTVPKQEHSYSCSIASDGDSVPSSPLSLDMQDDMESECFPCIPLNKASQRSFIKGLDQGVYIKNEPSSPPPPSPPPPSRPSYAAPNTFAKIIKQEPDSCFQIKPECLVSKSGQQSLLKSGPVTTRILCPKVSIKLEDGSSLRVSSGSLTAVTSLAGSSISCGSNNSMLVSRQRILPAARQAISSPLISTQLKGSTGVLYLTEEEKRTLISEGYPIPTKLPLSKAEERSLKKIRRKIKNKISAQESRRKKKEYMDSLERKYEIMQNEANTWRAKAEALQCKNAALSKQISQLEEKLKMADKTQSINGTEIAYILPVDQSIDIESDSLQTIHQDKHGVPGFQEISSSCLDIDVD